MGVLTKEHYQFFIASQINNVKCAKSTGNIIVLKRTVRCLTETLEDAKNSGFSDLFENIDKDLLNV